MATVACALLVWLSAAQPAPAYDTVIDAFHDASTEQARRRWTTSEGTPPVAVVRDGDRPVLESRPPTGPEASRIVLDRIGHWDFRSPNAFRMQLRVRASAGPTRVTLYFRSRSGWFALGRGVASDQWQTLIFPKSEFGVEDKPVGWGSIDRIRIALWFSPAADPRPILQLRRLAMVEHSVAILFDGARSGGAADDRARMSRSVADRVARLLAAAGVEADLLDQASLERTHLRSRYAVVLPYNPRLGEESTRLLVEWVERGGHVVACYDLPTPLQEAIGIGLGPYERPNRPGRFARIVPVAPRLPGFPDEIRQASWNIVPGIARGHGARIAALWHDERGGGTGRAAWVTSRRGAYFSHIVLEDDPQGKQAMLLSVLGALEPRVWRDAVASRIEKAGRIGHCLDLASWRAFVDRRTTPELAALRRKADALQGSVDALRKQTRYADAYALVEQLDAVRRSAYRQSLDSPTVEARGWWNHSGTGAYPGDWERTAKELADAGFNMVLPNMLWGGVAHYPSDVLPRSETFRKYGDQIKQCVAAAHRHGLQVHVWKVNFNLGRSPRSFVERLRREGRLQVSHDGTPRDWLNPAHPDNVALEVDSMLEVVKRYDVDGIHFDYIRYPSRDFDYSEYSRKAFERHLGRRVENWPGDCYSGALRAPYAAWRMQQITNVVRHVARRVRAAKPNMKISAAVFGAYPDCRMTVAQDWVSWAKRGDVDFLCPMNYSDRDDVFVALFEQQRAHVGPDFPLYPGIGATASRSRLDPERVLGQIELARARGIRGFTIFNLTQDTLRAIGPAFRASAGRRPAMPPHDR